MIDKFSKVLLAGILISLLVIIVKPNNIQVSSPNACIYPSEKEEIIQLAPNRIAVIDNRSASGTTGTILVFEYDSNNHKFIYTCSMNYKDYLCNPQKYAIPNN